MESAWKRRYAKLISELVRHCNLVYSNTNMKIDRGEGHKLTMQEHQLLEYLVEHPEENSNMMTISAALGIPQSSLSKDAKALLENKLVEKYMLVGNRKNIILKATPKGVQSYQVHCESFTIGLFSPFLNTLDAISDEDIFRFTEALRVLNKKITEDKEVILIKVE